MISLSQISLQTGTADGEAAAGEVTLIIVIQRPEIEMSGGNSHVLIDGWGASSIPGTPELPEKSLYLPCIEPDEVEIERIQLIGENAIHLPGPVHSSSPIAVDGMIEEVSVTEDRGSAWILGSLVHGRSSFLVIRLSPFEAEGATLTYPDSIEITLSLPNKPAFGRVSAPTDMEQPADIEPDWEPSPQLWDVGGYIAPAPLSAGASYHNAIPPTECAIIVGSSGYNTSVQPLAQWKIRKGVYTRVVETGWITSRYTGADTQEKVRKYLQDLYNNENLKWVILGGDHGDVPSRLAYVPDGYQDTGSDGSYAASDAYYADLAGSGHTPYDWDGDNDGEFGEYNVDGIDLTAEVYVGRLSATSTTQMDTLVDNILDYERDPPTGGWFNHTVLAGAYSNYDTTNELSYDRNDTTDEANLSEAIRLDFMDDGTKINYTLYEQGGIWPSQQPCNASLTTSNLISAIDNGASMVNLAGHGSYLGIYRQIWNSDANSNGLCDPGEYSSPSYYTTSASQDNGGKKPLFYNDACNNGEFDRQVNCLTEDILRDVGIGAIGSSRVSWYTPHWSKGTDGGTANQGHDYRFWEQMLDEGHYHPGEALYKSKSDYIGDRPLFTRGVWKNLLQYNLMGDPEVPIWTQVPGELNVTYPIPLASPGSPTFTVKDGSGNPVPGATVCLMNGSNFFGVGTTGASGDCQISIPSVLQRMNLTATMHNFLPYEEEVMVGVDATKPEILSVQVGGNLSTGDVFGISAIASDNIGVSGAYLEYNWSSSSPSSSYNSTMVDIGSDTFYFTSSHPLYSLDPLWYRVHIHDEAGNWNETSWAQAAIVDNDTVLFGEDGSQSGTTTGDPYTFRVNISDNIQVSEGDVEYWFGTGPSFNISLTGGPITFTTDIIIPWNSTDMLHYLFHACDGAGNWNSSAQGYAIVTDDDDPSLYLDQTPSVGTTGDPFSFNVTATDNIDVGSIRIEYWFGDGPHVNRTSIGAVQFTYMMDIPGDSVEPLHYILHILDSSGNGNSTVQKDVMIVDDDLPEFLEDHTGLYPTTGDPFTLMISAGDNIKVSGVVFNWMIDWGDWDYEEGAYDDVNDTWGVTMEIPYNSIGTLESIVDISDDEGNTLTYRLLNRTVADNDLPVFISDGSDTTATTGDGFTFRCTLEDNIEILNATVSYRLGDDYVNMIMERVGRGTTFWASVVLPSDRSGVLDYMFIFNDTSGNINRSVMFNMSIVDDDLPILGELIYDHNPTTGDPFEVTVAAEDSVLLSEVELEFILPGGLVSNTTPMVWSSERYSKTINIPANRTGGLSFRVVARDGADNLNRSDMVTLQVVDNDPPILLNHDIPTEGTTGDILRFTFTGGDNIGITSALFQMFMPGENITADISGSDGVFSGSLPLGSGVDGRYPYRLVLGDEAGNEVALSGNITIRDNDPPTVSIGSLPEELDLQETVWVEVTAQDNVGLDQVRLFASGGGANLTLTIEDGRALFDPIGAGTWTFSAQAMDLEGNELWTTTSILVVDRVPPSIGASVPQEGTAGDEITLNAVGSSDGSGIESFTWQILGPDGEERELQGETVNFVPWLEGEYNITLTVTDNEGNSQVEYFTVTAMPSEGDPVDGDDAIMFWAILGGILILLLIIGLALFLVLRKRKDTGDAGEEAGSVVIMEDHDGSVDPSDPEDEEDEDMDWD